MREEAAVTYLSTVLSNNTKHHIDTRIKAAHRALWSTICWSMCKWCKLLKSALGLPKFCDNTPLLEALAVKRIAKLLQVQQLSLLRKAIINNSKARTFYMYMIKRGTTQSDKNLITKCFNIRKTHHVSLMRYLFDERYANQCKKQIHSVSQNGVTDSVRTLLTNWWGGTFTLH